MTIYYWESEFRYGEVKQDTDENAIKEIFGKIKYGDSLLIIYKETDSGDGTPFITIWEMEE